MEASLRRAAIESWERRYGPRCECTVRHVVMDTLPGRCAECQRRVLPAELDLVVEEVDLQRTEVK